MKTREAVRVPVCIRVLFTEVGGQSRQGLTAFLGGGGCFILSTEPLSEGVVLRLDFSLGNKPEPIRIVGKVVWKRIGPSGDILAGFGVQFKNLSPKDKEAIEQFVESETRRKSKSGGRYIPPQPPAEPSPA